MPRVKIDYVVSFSSEDNNNPANNLLQWEVLKKKKWLCAKGEPTCSVVLQLSKSVKISSVNIGACHTALVEVLVGRSETPNDQFQVLVPSSIFLTPMESRKDDNVEKVRFFSADQLAEPARNNKWDRVRVVCSQPYNKHCQYGLAFIEIYEPETGLPSRLFQLDTRSSDEEDFRPGQLFAQHSQGAASNDGQAADTGYQIRQATSQALKNISEESTRLVKATVAKVHSTPKNKNTTQNHKDSEKPSSSKHGTERNQKDKERRSGERGEQAKRHDRGERARSSDRGERVKGGEKRERSWESEGRRKRDRHQEAEVESSEPHELLRGVELVLSGYENPLRAQLRTLALAMGARCHRDWGPTCTHLICAFPNTPKLRAVRASKNGAGAVVVKGTWLQACADQRRKLPWRPFATQPGQRASESPSPRRSPPSESDTDDEIERAVARQKRLRASPEPCDSDSTLEMEFPPPAKIAEDAALPQMLGGTTLWVGGAGGAGLDARLLRRYVRAYGGVLQDGEGADVDLCGPGGSGVRADWLWRCHERQSLVSTQDFRLS